MILEAYSYKCLYRAGILGVLFIVNSMGCELI